MAYVSFSPEESDGILEDLKQDYPSARETSSFFFGNVIEINMRDIITHNDGTLDETALPTTKGDAVVIFRERIKLPTRKIESTLWYEDGIISRRTEPWYAALFSSFKHKKGGIITLRGEPLTIDRLLDGI